MQPDDQPQPSRETLDYETPLATARRVFTVPRKVYAVHRALLDNVEVLSIVYGIFVMMIGWVLRGLGIVFVVAPERGGPRPTGAPPAAR